MTLDTGTVITINIPAILRTGQGSALAWRDEGTDLGAVTAVDIRGDRVQGAVVAGVLTLTVSDGAVTPAINDNIYFGTSDDDVISAVELTIAAVNGVGVIPAYAGHRYHILARTETEEDITEVYYSDDPTMDNTIHAYTKLNGALVPPGENTDFAVWRSNQLLSNANDVTVTVR